MPRPHHTNLAGVRAQGLRNALTISEARLWSVIKSKRLFGLRFRRQVPIGRFIADFACLDPKVVIEVDGPSHDFTDETPRTSFLEDQGFTVIRVSNEAVAMDLDQVVFYLKWRLRQVMQLPDTAGVSPPAEEETPRRQPT